MHKTMLIILDGWGLNPDPEVSAVEKANTPFFDSLMERYPNSTLITHGPSSGLPEGQMGNSEVGHMNLGAGRIVYQDLLRINQLIDNGALEHNEMLQAALAAAWHKQANLHVLGIVSDGGIHGHIDHMKAIATYAARANLTQVFFHCFTDGRDTDPRSGAGFVRKLQKHLDTSVGQIATVVGRYYAMDRDTRWERIAKAYHAMVHGQGQASSDPVAAVKASYEQGITDEFIEPVVQVNEEGDAIGTIREGDVVIFTNFRGDRARQITEALTQKDHPEHQMKTLALDCYPFKLYEADFEGLHPLFTHTRAQNIMGEVLAAHGKTQLRIAETEKYAHVTYFFNNGEEEPFEGEHRIIVPSPRDVKNYDEKPEMSAREVTARCIDYVDEEAPDFVCLNFANPDMVGHTGNFEATVKACEIVDECLRELVETGQKHDYAMLIVADHGNADVLRNPDGSPNTNHSKSPVPCIIVGYDGASQLKNGKLADVAPTLLRIMDLDIPEKMTGDILIR